MRLLIRKKGWWTALAVIVALMMPNVAYAHEGKEEVATDEANQTSEEETPTPEVENVVSTLPVLGAGLNVTISRAENGEIASVGLDPSVGSTIIEEGDHKVVFLLGDGDTEVIVKSAQGVVQTKVKADDPADVTGDGAWVGDVFGTGEITVPYSVSFNEEGAPLISVGTPVTPEGVTADVGEAKMRSSDDGDRAFSKVKVELTTGDQNAVLSLKAYAKVDDDGETRVGVSATLLSRDRVNCGFDGDGDRDWKDRDRDDEDDDSLEQEDQQTVQARWDEDDDSDRDGRDEWRDRDSRDEDDRDDRDDGDERDERSDRRQDGDGGDDR